MPRGALLGVPVTGHMNPALGLARELVDRGHELQVFATPAWRERIRAAGAVPRSYDHPALDDLDVPTNDLGVLAAALRVAEQVLPALIRDVEHAPAGQRPDYLVIDSLSPWGVILARRTGLPSITSCSTFAINNAVARMVNGNIGRLVPTLVRGAGSLIEIVRRLGILRRRFGVAPPRLTQLAYAPADETVVYTSRQLQPRSETFDERTHFVGPIVTARQEVWADPLAPGFVYVSLGTLFNDNPRFYRQVVDAFRDSDRDVLLNIGSGRDPRLLENVPAHIRVVSGVPQLAVLERAGVFITHGGMNSVHESLLSAVPMIVVPQAADQFLVAERVEHVGAGIYLRRGEVAPARISASVERLASDPSFGAACRRAGEALRAAGGAAHAADVVERRLAQPEG